MQIETVKRIALFCLPLLVVLGTARSIPIGPSSAINVGGALIPAILAALGMGCLTHEVKRTMALMFVMVVMAHLMSTVTTGGVEVAMWGVVLMAGALAAACSSRPAIMAYVIATLGVLIGADFLSTMVVQNGQIAIVGGAGVSDVVLLAGPLAAVCATAGKAWIDAI